MGYWEVENEKEKNSFVFEKIIVLRSEKTGYEAVLYILYNDMSTTQWYLLNPFKLMMSYKKLLHWFLEIKVVWRISQIKIFIKISIYKSK